MDFAGGMVWALDLDDFKNRGSEGHHPLMNQNKSVLGPKMTAHEDAARSQRCVFKIILSNDDSETMFCLIKSFINQTIVMF